MKHAKIFTRLAQRVDPNVPILEAAMDRIAELEGAIEKMRVAGGSVEFQMAFELAKDLL